MKSYHNLRGVCGTDYGPEPFVGNITAAAKQNQNFRAAYWTGDHLQMTLMNIPVRGDVGVEMHPDTDQYIRIESGQALVRMGECRESLCVSHHIRAGHGVFVPRGTWHNIINTGNCPLKLSSIYAPPQHPRGTIHCSKADAE